MFVWRKKEFKNWINSLVTFPYPPKWYSSILFQLVFDAKLRITSDKKLPFKEEKPITCWFLLEELIRPEIVPPVPIAQAICVK